MSPRYERKYLQDSSFIEIVVDIIEPDVWRSHGFRYRLAWIQDNKCRVLFDNHYGKGDHFHIEEREFSYRFNGIHQLLLDFYHEVRKLGGPI